ncbi:MAG: alpha/beta fold hydrolase [Gemmatimonadaceae bacterium]|nr:alpha/beta fold hydrolase [Gemmatimonadaceae bacterium]
MMHRLILQVLVPFSVSGQPVDAERGVLRVPAVRAQPTTDSLTLRYARFKSTASEPGAPIVFLAGGPGDAATRAFAGMPIALLDRLRALGDVIAFDQRGTGESEPLRPLCPPGAPRPLDRATAPDDLLDDLRARVRACLLRADSLRVPVAGLTTAESADDLEALRRALGVDRLNLLAGSYGTHLALAAVARHPTLVDRMVLVGVEGPDHTVKDPARVDDVLDVIAVARRPSLRADLQRLIDRLAGEPAHVSAPDGRVIVVGAWDFQRWVAEALDDVREIDAMLSAIPAMLDGDLRVLARWAAAHRAPRPLHLMNLAMDCASYISDARLARISRMPSGVLGGAMSFPLPWICDVPGLPRLPDAFRAVVQSDVETLLVAGTYDGRTPPANAREVAEGLPRSRVLIIDGASHALMGHADVTEALLRFFARRTP